MRQAIYLTAKAALFAATAGAAIWGWSQNPLGQALVERSAAATGRAIEAAFHRSFTPEEAARLIIAALTAEDTARALWLADLAEDEAVPLPPDLNLQIEELRAAEDSAWAQTKDCGACALDLRSCTSLAQMGLCAVPVELSPLGDLNALRRQGMNALTGTEVDNLEVGLALTGLAATSAVLLTGGGSAVVKAGATALRGARRLGSLTPGLMRSLGRLTDLPVNWSAVARAAPLEDITDLAKLQRLGGLATDIGRIAGNTSAAETLLLLRHVDNAEDAARLARISDVTKAKTLSRAEVLGKSRLFRATLRVSDAALSALAAIWAGVTGLLALIAGQAGQAVLRLLKPRPAPGIRMPPPMRRH